GRDRGGRPGGESRVRLRRRGRDHVRDRRRDRRKGVKGCPSRRRRRSGWTGSSSTGTTPVSTSSPTRCTTAPVSSRASAPTRPPTAAAVFPPTHHRGGFTQSPPLFLRALPYSVDELVEATKETIRVNDLESCYIRPIAYLGYGEMGLNPLPCPINVSIAVWPWGTYLGDRASKDGVRMKVSSGRRMDPNVNPGAAKGTGIYINSTLAKVEALRSG